MWSFTWQGHNLSDIIWRDPLTNAINGAVVRKYGLPERRALNTGFVVIYIDINKFKEINDHLGHEFGDKTLVRVVQALQREFSREHDLVMRQGGDEFIVILPSTDLNFARQGMSNVNASLRNVTLSYGIEPCENLKTLDRAINIADSKMYLMKNGIS